MRRFWRYQVQYRTAKCLMELGLWLLPHGRYKAELLEALWTIRGRMAKELGQCNVGLADHQ